VLAGVVERPVRTSDHLEADGLPPN
jgi:hypothetical protein